jgi:hypothetical protein
MNLVAKDKRRRYFFYSNFNQTLISDMIFSLTTIYAAGPVFIYLSYVLFKRGDRFLIKLWINTHFTSKYISHSWRRKAQDSCE